MRHRENCSLVIKDDPSDATGVPKALGAVRLGGSLNFRVVGSVRETQQSWNSCGPTNLPEHRNSISANQYYPGELGGMLQKDYQTGSRLIRTVASRS